MTTSPPPRPPMNWPPQYGQPPWLAPPPQFGRSGQLMPPPRFGRLTHPTRQHRPVAATPQPPLHGGQPAPAAPVPQHGPSTRAVPPARDPDPDPDPNVNAPSAAGVPGPLADFGARAISFLIDYAAPMIVLNLLLAIGVATGRVASPLAFMVLGYLGLLSFGLWNSGYLQGTTGRSLGRRVAKTALVTIGTGQPVGVGRAVARQICHGLEFGIGYLWPLWDGKRQTFADKIVGTVVIRPAQPKIEATDHSRLAK
jgi:uncharacterized RDD family membrane protein YckC